MTEHFKINQSSEYKDENHRENIKELKQKTLQTIKPVKSQSGALAVEVLEVLETNIDFPVSALAVVATLGVKTSCPRQS